MWYLPHSKYRLVANMVVTSLSKAKLLLKDVACSLIPERDSRYRMSIQWLMDSRCVMAHVFLAAVSMRIYFASLRIFVEGFSFSFILFSMGGELNQENKNLIKTKQTTTSDSQTAGRTKPVTACFFIVIGLENSRPSSQ